MNEAINPSKVESRLPALDKTFNLLIGILIYSSAFYFFSSVTADMDLWGHIKFGKDMLGKMAFQRADIYSYTAFGSEWVNHEWLSELLAVLVSYQAAFAGYKYVKAEWNIIVDPSKYPVSAVGFLKQNGIKGQILVPFEWGEYAIWKLYPDCRVSIDGRFRTVYSEGALSDHFQAARDEEKLKDLLNKYPADIILGRQNKLYQQLISTDARYIYVYSDPTSIVFLKDVDSQRDILNKFRREKLLNPKGEASPYFP